VKSELLQQVTDLAARLKRAPERAGEVFAQRLDYLGERLAGALRNAAATAENRLSRSSQRLLPALKDAVAVAERRLADFDHRLLPSAKDALSRVERRLVAAESKLMLLDPSNPLKRGYSLTLDASGAIVRSVSAISPGDLLVTRLADGEVESRVCAPSACESACGGSDL
jgi:exodeoxyribonuclease VII large subunit